VRRSDLPFGSEFSPSQIRLERVLELADLHGGDWKALEDAIRTEYFEGERFADTSEYNKRKLSNNTRLGMVAYGIIERDGNLTEFGRLLHSVRQDERQLYEDLARHILLNRHGLTLVQCIQDMQTAGETVNLPKSLSKNAVRASVGAP
jgi:hypothetical protein